MSAFSPIPLGRPIPDAPHAVSCSLPTMRDVRGYEEKDPAVTSRMTSGYPRFVVHPFAVRLAQHLTKERGLAGRKLWLTSSERMAAGLAAHLRPVDPSATVWVHEGLSGVTHADVPEIHSRAKVYLQHLGGFLSSREAEDRLAALGLLPGAQPEEIFSGDAAAEVRRHLRSVLTTAGEADLLLAPSGMNAVYAAFRAISEMQAARGRTIWVQLGWLYIDTIALLAKFTSHPSDDHVCLPDVFDLKALERLFAERGTRIAGVIAEVATNPLIQTPDVPALYELCRRHGVRLMVDPSVSSVFSVDVLPVCDLLVSSLTKYTAAEGDIIAGLAAVNPSGADAAALRARIGTELEPFYPRDLARLAVEIASTHQVLNAIEANAVRVARFLESHPKVKEVYWALRPDSRPQYLRVARGPDAVGGLITFTLKGPMEPFYDRLRLAKGPSFGMRTTLICPQMYLAHYDLVTTAAGLAELARYGIDPELLRLCVGTEPADEIIAALTEAFEV